MEWLIIVFILMFVIAPVMWLKPSPRQQRQMALRSCAARQGGDGQNGQTAAPSL